MARTASVFDQLTPGELAAIDKSVAAAAPPPAGALDLLRSLGCPRTTGQPAAQGIAA